MFFVHSVSADIHIYKFYVNQISAQAACNGAYGGGAWWGGDCTNAYVTTTFTNPPLVLTSTHYGYDLGGGNCSTNPAAGDDQVDESTGECGAIFLPDLTPYPGWDEAAEGEDGGQDSAQDCQDHKVNGDFQGSITSIEQGPNPSGCSARGCQLGAQVLSYDIPGFVDSQQGFTGFQCGYQNDGSGGTELIPGGVDSGSRYQTTTDTSTSSSETLPNGDIITTTTTVSNTYNETTLEGGGCDDPLGCEDFDELLESADIAGDGQGIVDQIGLIGDQMENDIDSYSSDFGTDETTGFVTDGGFISKLNLIPAFSSCTPFNMTNSKFTLTISCSDTQPLRDLLYWMIYLNVIFQLYRMMTAEEF